MSIQWKPLHTERVWDGFRVIDRVRYQLPDGKEDYFEIKIERDVVVVLALTAQRTVILTRQYRPGPDALLLELPGGAIDEGETPEVAIARELLEETGYHGTLASVGMTYDDAYSTGRRYAFVATDCEKVQEPDTDEHEHIEVVEMSLPDFIQHIRDGAFTDLGSAVQALLHLGILREEL